MELATFLRNWADRVDPPQPAAPFEMPELPQGAVGLIDEINHAEVVGQPGTEFTRANLVFTDATGKKNKRTFKYNVHVSGCGHNVNKTEDIAFTSYISSKPVCKICEREYRRMRNQTRHEKCVCRHLVAPHELKYVEGKGFVCKECKKKIDRQKPLKAIGWLLGLFLKPLILEEPAQNKEVPYEITELPPEEPYPPVPYYPQARIGYPPPHQAPYELDRRRPQGPNHPL